MRDALIADIHGNAVALETVLAHLAGERVDRIICLGDVALRGPEPRRVLHLLRELGCPVIRGNGDTWMLNRRRLPARVSPVTWMEENDDWCADQLTSNDLSFMAAFPATLEVPLAGARRLLCFHGSPRSDSEELSAATTAEHLASMLDGARHDVLVGGHTHMALLRHHGLQLLLNPGSVGQPVVWSVDGRTVHVLPEAHYGLLDSTEDKLSVEFKRVTIDVDAVVRAAFTAGMPAAKQWETQWRTGIFRSRGA